MSIGHFGWADWEEEGWEVCVLNSDQVRGIFTALGMLALRWSRKQFLNRLGLFLRPTVQGLGPLFFWFTYASVAS